MTLRPHHHPNAPAASSAAPAASREPSGRLALGEAVGRLLVLSWNPGGGCRNLVHVLEEVGYHVVIIQEAWLAQLRQLDEEKWSWSLECQQFVASRRPSRVACLGGQEDPGKIRWAAFTVHFDEPRAGRAKLGILSMHVNNDRVKEWVAAPADIARVIDLERLRSRDPSAIRDPRSETPAIPDRSGCDPGCDPFLSTSASLGAIRSAIRIPRFRVCASPAILVFLRSSTRPASWARSTSSVATSTRLVGRAPITSGTRARWMRWSRGNTCRSPTTAATPAS